MTPLTLGIKTLGGVLTPMITRNTTIPTRKTEIYTTAADNQPSVEVEVFQGERPMADDNKKIGSFHLDGITPAPARVPKIEVTFEIDANGVLSVTAKDMGTQKQQSIRIEGSSGMTKDEVEKMKRDAELHADDDRKKKEFADAKNEAENRIYAVEKAMTEAGDKIAENDKAPVQGRDPEGEGSDRAGRTWPRSRRRRRSWTRRPTPWPSTSTPRRAALAGKVRRRGPRPNALRRSGQERRRRRRDGCGVRSEEVKATARVNGRVIHASLGNQGGVFRLSEE